MKIPSKKKGLTLIEIIISLAILSIVIIPLGNLALTSVRIEKDSEIKLKANTIAQQIIEYIKEPSVTLNNIDTALKVENLSLTDFNNNIIKDCLVDGSIGKTKEDFLFYKTDVKDCYVRVEVAPVNYDAKAVVPEDEESSIWENAIFQYKIKIAKDNSNNLNLYDVSSTTEFFKKNLSDTAVTTVLNITDNGSELSYDVYQDEVLKFSDTPKDTIGKVPSFNFQIESGSPNIIVNVENVDETRTIKLFIDELIGENKEEYTPNYKVFSKGKVGVYTKMRKKNKSFSDVKKVYKVEVKVYKYKAGDKSLLQNITDYKYVDGN